MRGYPAAVSPESEGFSRDWSTGPIKQNVRVFLSRWRSHQTCPACHGARLRPEALAVKIEGCDIAALSAMSIRDARAFIGGLSDLRHHPAPARILAQVESRLGYLGAIGLDYLTLDRPARSLSAGELQRVTLSKTLGSGLVNTFYVLDEPTAGLHPQEIERLITILHRLRNQGNTLVVVEHDHTLISDRSTWSILAPAPVRRAVRSSTPARSIDSRRLSTPRPATICIGRKRIAIRGDAAAGDRHGVSS